MEESSYYAVIPANVRYSSIPNGAKLLYGEITALSNKEGYCWASNSYFARLYECGNDTISRWIAALIGENFIKSEIDIAQGNLRKLYIGSAKEVSAKMPRGIRKNTDRYTEKSVDPIRKNPIHNNTMNITSNTTSNIESTPAEKCEEFFSLSPSEISDRMQIEESRQEEFIREIDKFQKYWKEKNKSGTKMRYQMEKTFEVSLRLSTWFARSKKDFSNSKS